MLISYHGTFKLLHGCTVGSNDGLNFILTLNCIRGGPWYPTFGFSALAF